MVKGGGSSSGGSASGGGGGGGAGTPSAVTVPFSHDFSAAPVVTVSGVSSGAVVNLYSNSSCSTQVGAATASGTTVDITLSGVAAGTHTYYAKSTASGVTSSCSTAKADYTRVACPAGYVEVQGNTSRSTKPFCVMKFEARDVAGVPTSQAAGVPIYNASPNSAKAACVGLNIGATTPYNLISNAEWMAMQHEVTNLTDNTHNNTMSLYVRFPKGFSTDFGSAPLTITDPSDPWTDLPWGGGTGNFDNKRTYVLKSGEIIWDIVGNAGEIVDWGTHATTYTRVPACSSQTTVDMAGTPPCPAIANTNYRMAMLWTQADNNVGQIRSWHIATSLYRGGYQKLTSSGIGTFLMSGDTDLDAVVTGVLPGFRCVFRPELE